MNGNLCKIALVIAFCFVFGASENFAQCGADGKQPCNPTPKKSTPKKTTKSTVSKPTTPTKKTSANVSKSRTKFVPRAPEIEMVKIPAGSFMMGSAETEKAHQKDESPQYRVNIAYDFYLGKYEVTNSQWKAVMGNLPSCDVYSRASEKNNFPVECISWELAQQYILKLNNLQKDFEYRLPSESEWEYAVRGGTTTRFYWGDDLNYTLICKYANVQDLNTKGTDYETTSEPVANCNDKYLKTAPVGTYLPNSFGLFDMSGNVGEWCEDVWNENYVGLQSDGSPNKRFADSDYHVVRGGAWSYVVRQVRSASRNNYGTTVHSPIYGFRLAARPK